MASLNVNFFKEGIAFRLSNQPKLKKWIADVVGEKKYSVLQLNYIFCTDAYLLKLNKEYLNHNTFTDIITFPARIERTRSGGNNSSEKKVIEGDIFISYERVKVNAAKFKTSVDEELHRVMIHGVLHLLGYKDKLARDKAL